MVNPAILATIVATNNMMMMAQRRRHEEEERQRRRREEEARRRRHEEEARRRREEEARRRRREEERRRHEKEEHKRKHYIYQQENAILNNVSQSVVYEFTKTLKLHYDDLAIVATNAYESILADGSVLSELDKKYVRRYPDGRIQEYEADGSYLELTREELPNGAMVAYQSGKKVYEKDEHGNYKYHKLNSKGKLQEVIEGTYEAQEYSGFSDKLEIKFSELIIAHKGAYESILADGSRLSEFDGKYRIINPNGRIQEYESTGHGSSAVLKLTKEELPDGSMVAYQNGKKVYEKDEEGNYTYNVTDRDGNIKESIQGKIDTQKPTGFTDKLEIECRFHEVHESAFETLLADGTRMVFGKNDIVEAVLPNGIVREYNRYWGSPPVLKLIKEELPNGAMVSYENGKKIYQRDEEGNYTYYVTDRDGNIKETIQGKVDTQEPKGFTEQIEVTYSELQVAHRGLHESILADGSRLSEYDNYYIIRCPNGVVQEYVGSWNGKHMLLLTREELPNGAMVVYDQGQKIYERNKEGQYVFHKYKKKNKIQSIVEGDATMWKKTVYDDNGEASYYVTSDEPNKKYFPSGKLFEEVKDDGSCYMYVENGICVYEKDKDGNYARYQLTPDGQDRLLVQKGKGNSWSEKYEYYPSGQIKSEERCLQNKWNTICRRYAENGICLYDNDGHGNCTEYQLTPDGQDRLLVRKEKDYRTIERHKYYLSGKLQESKYEDGTIIKYNEDGTYQKFDKSNRLKEETTAEGKTTYTYYKGTKQVEHIHKYDLQGKSIESEYKHFDKKGKENTKYYLSLKRIIAKKLEDEDKKAEAKGIAPEDRKASSKMTKAQKLKTQLIARYNSMFK